MITPPLFLKAFNLTNENKCQKNVAQKIVLSASFILNVVAVLLHTCQLLHAMAACLSHEQNRNENRAWRKLGGTLVGGLAVSWPSSWQVHHLVGYIMHRLQLRMHLP